MCNAPKTPKPPPAPAPPPAPPKAYLATIGKPLTLEAAQQRAASLGISQLVIPSGRNGLNIPQ